MPDLRLTADQLAQIAPGAGLNADAYAGPLSDAAARFDISTPQRMAAWLAQMAEETGGFTVFAENLNYSADGLMKEWPSRFPEATAQAYARHPEQIANHVYGGRMGNGPESSGDGWRFRGRGPMQLTGRAAYAACARALGLPLLDQPDLLLNPGPGALSAAWAWAEAGCNPLADRDQFATITLRLNGGATNYPARVEYWRRARQVLGVPILPPSTVAAP